MSRILTILCKGRKETELAMDALSRAQVPSEDISLLVSDAVAGREFRIEEHTKGAEGAAAGAVAGGTLGAIAAGLAAAGVVVAPGIGLVTAGPLLASLAGAGAGGAAGTLVGALIGRGVKEHEAKAASRGLADGQILLAVRVHEDRVRSAREPLLSAVPDGNIHVADAR